jgi:hypothetical protein
MRWNPSFFIPDDKMNISESFVVKKMRESVFQRCFFLLPVVFSRIFRRL